MINFYLIVYSFVSWCALGVTRDICGSYNGGRIYLELGEKGVITAKNTTAVLHRSSYASNLHLYNSTSHEQCNLQFVTCPNCVIVITFLYMNLAYQCSGINNIMDSPCHCDYVWLSEPPYEEESGIPVCGIFTTLLTDTSGTMTYRSQTRTLSVAFLFSEIHLHAFSFEYRIERNRQFIKGRPSNRSSPTFGRNSLREGILKSPFFPAFYPRDLGIEYVVACQTDSAVPCRIRILFQDFRIDVSSVIEFYDWNGQRLDISSGTAFRPPVILSTGPSVMIRFYANGGTDHGYKATYSFLNGDLQEENIKPYTDCGGDVENLGGAITMMNMTVKGTTKSFDCVWLIRPPKNYLHLKTHLYLKISTFSAMAGTTELRVLRGLTSEESLLEMLHHPVPLLQPLKSKEHIVPVAVGFYVSLRGTFGSASHLAIIYAAFSYSDCFSSADTLCENHRCIPSQLFCDGFDHCGDLSDEPVTCSKDWKLGLTDHHRYLITPNYYFPKMERYPDLRTATLIFMISSLGLIFLISTLIILLFRMGSRVRHQREIQNRLRTISNLLAVSVLPDENHSGGETTDDPPIYEAPPDYDDVIKVFDISTEVQNSKCVESHSTGVVDGNRMVNVGQNIVSVLETSRPTYSLPESQSFQQSQSVSVPANFNCLASNKTHQSTPIPDSPPPPYTEGACDSHVSSHNHKYVYRSLSDTPCTSFSQERYERFDKGIKGHSGILLDRTTMLNSQLLETDADSGANYSNEQNVPNSSASNRDI